MAEPISIIAIIVASVSVVIAVLTFILSWNKSKIEKLTHESQFIRDIQKELVKTEHTFREIKTKEDCLFYVWNYLNTIDRLCYFDSKGWLSNGMIEFFTNYIEVAKTHYNWLISIKHMSKQKMKKGLPYILSTCDKHSINESNFPLPDIFQKFSSLP